MSIKSYKPYTPSRRFMKWYGFEEITTTTPEKSLLRSKKRSAWRNNAWRITSRFRWGGHKRRYRLIDLRRYDKENIPARVASVEYDPYRNARISLLHYADGEKRYVLSWKWATVGNTVMCGSDAGLEHGNRKQLKDIPDGFSIYNLEYTPFTKGKLLRSAWSSAVLSWRDEQKGLAYIKLPSGEIRMFDFKCWATIWQVWNEEHANIVIGKAWRNRWKGRRPHVLGKSMNPVDHPHGWWEWHTDIALVYPKSFTGRPVPPGKKTRKKKKRSDKFIVQRRK